MKPLKDFFRRRSGAQSTGNPESQPLCIDGISPAPLTPEPDDAELAAQALLEMMAGNKNFRYNEIPKAQNNEEQSASYYRALADRLRAARRKAAQQATRFVAFCEYKLKEKHLPTYGPGSLRLLEVELYKRLDIIDREGGELKRRWQRCLAEVTVRLMNAESPEEEVTQKT